MKLFNFFNLGYATKAIGHKLYISTYTVSRHLRNICAKCKARNSIHLMGLCSSFEGTLKHHPTLSPRENQIMDLLLSGMTSTEIAKALGVGIATVRKHRENTLWKLEVYSTRQAVALFLRIEKP